MDRPLFSGVCGDILTTYNYIKLHENYMELGEIGKNRG